MNIAFFNIIARPSPLMESEEILEMYKKFMRNTTESDVEEEQIELENSEKDFEDDFKYEELKRQIRRKYRVIKKIGNAKVF